VADCANCGAVLGGPYCSQCGQEDGPLRPSIHEFVREFGNEHFGLDSKIGHTLRLLLIPGALCTHVASGLSLRLYRYFKQWQRYGSRPPKSVDVWRWHNFSGVSRAGWLAIPAVVAHGVLMRVVPLAVDGDSSEIGLEYLAYGFWRGNWGKWIGGVFYTGFVGVVSYHVVCGWASYLKVHPRRRNMVLGAAATWAAVWLAGLGRVVAGSGKVGGYMGRHYEQLYRIFFRRL